MRDPVIVLSLIFLLFLIGSPIYYRYRVSALLSKHIGDPPTLTEIRQRLIEINTVSPTYMFTVERHANIKVRDRIISFAFGPVGSLAPSGDSMWNTRKSIFAVVDTEQTPWMESNSDVFKPAFIGPIDSVYWIAIGKLKCRTNRGVLLRSFSGASKYTHG